MTIHYFVLKRTSFRPVPEAVDECTLVMANSFSSKRTVYIYIYAPNERAMNKRTIQVLSWRSAKKISTSKLYYPKIVIGLHYHICEYKCISVAVVFSSQFIKKQDCLRSLIIKSTHFYKARMWIDVNNG